MHGAGYHVIISEDGEEAVKKFMENHEAVCLCLLDMNMPKKKGIAVYHEIRKINPDIKVIFMSGYPSDMIDRSMLPNEDVAILLKPVQPKDILIKVKEVLAG